VTRLPVDAPVTLGLLAPDVTGVSMSFGEWQGIKKNLEDAKVSI